MLKATAKHILKLLQPEHPTDLRCAAARVLREIGSPAPELAQVLCDALEDSDPSLRLQVLATIGHLRIKRALPQLLVRVRQGGPEAAAAAAAAAHLGSTGTRALQKLMPQVAPGLRRRIATALAAGRSASAGSAAVDTLLDKDPGVVDAAVRSLISEIPSLPDAQRRALTEQIVKLLKPQKGSHLPAASETALVRLLAALGDPRGEAAFWSRIEPPHSAELRAAALHALGALPFRHSKEKLKRLLDCAANADFRVAAPALMILKNIPVTERTAKDWLPLLDAPDAATRRFGIDQLAGRDTPELARALLRQLSHPDRNLREQAQLRLGQTKHGREALASALLAAESPEETWALAGAQAPLISRYSPSWRKRLFTRACACLEANDPRAEALLSLLRAADARALRDQLEERALSLRTKKAYAIALVYLRHLTRDPASAEALRFEMAACGLKLSEHDLAVESRAADPCLQQFARLIHNHDVDPVDRLKQAKWLGPEDLFYLGFHFAEGDKQDREFGAQALRLLLKQSPRAKVAKDAKRKLRSAGLE